MVGELIIVFVSVLMEAFWGGFMVDVLMGRFVRASDTFLVALMTGFLRADDDEFLRVMVAFL